MGRRIRDVPLIDLYLSLIPPFLGIAGTWTAYAFLLLDDNIVITIQGRDFKWLVFLLFALTITYWLSSYFAIGIVYLYKIWAPEETRARCRFEPTCSTYMILAIQKYGTLIGLIKGLNRISRCKPPNGGIDYP